MSNDAKFSLLRKILKALGLSDERIEELFARIQEWLLDDKETDTGQLHFPYHQRDHFLSPAELSFLRALKVSVSDWALIAPKVRLGDLFYAQTGDYGQNRAHRNRIDRRHVDFLLCDPDTIKPVLGIELDDKSHQRKDREQRDKFVDGVFAAAKLPLVHIPVNHGYGSRQLDQLLKQQAKVLSGQEAVPPVEIELKPPTPNCPGCGAEMVLRTAKSGPSKGNQFWGCSTFPQCRGIREYARES